MEIKDWVKQNISMYNNAHLSEIDIKKLKSALAKRLCSVIPEFFPDYEFVFNDGLISNCSNMDEELPEKFTEFYHSVIEECKAQKQSDKERSRYGDHKELYETLFDNIGYMKNLILP